MPLGAGLIVADSYGAEIVRECIAAASRRALLLRFAQAADRLIVWSIPGPRRLSARARLSNKRPPLRPFITILEIKQVQRAIATLSFALRRTAA
jgi:hypothetical protein